MFPREKALIVVEITLFLQAWLWPLSNEKLHDASSLPKLRFIFHK